MTARNTISENDYQFVWLVAQGENRISGAAFIPEDATAAEIEAAAMPLIDALEEIGLLGENRECQLTVKESTRSAGRTGYEQSE